MDIKAKFEEIISKMNEMDRKKLILIMGGTFLFLGFIFGLAVNSGPESSSQGTPVAKEQKAKKDTVWTCAMHPHIRESKAGKCRICGMTLIPLEGEHDDSSADENITVKLSPKAMKLAEVQIATVERKLLSNELKMLGKIEFDETREAHITAWFPGRIEQMYVDYTGVKVNKGDHMVKIYSPEILATQEELIQSIKAIKDIKDSGYSGIKGLTADTIKDVRGKLILWGFSKKQIAEIERRKKTTDTMVIYSPVSGVVVTKHVKEGMYVKEGSKIYSIADLSHLWVKLDVYESDIHFINYGQDVKFYTEAYPGRIFKGRVSFIDPVLSTKTQTIKVRVNIENPDGKLKPGMFIHAIIYSQVSASGVVIDTSLKGKFMCPMHPEIITDKKGNCPVCGMKLVSTKSLGYVHEHTIEDPIVIPATGPLITGTRAIVYVFHGEGKFEGREIVLGHRVGKYYVVKSGLMEGEKIAVNGNFKIDSAAQLLSKPSMMNPAGGGPAPGGMAGMDMGGDKSKKSAGKKMDMPDGKKMDMPADKKIKVPVKFKKQFDGVLKSYLEIQMALTNDEIERMNDLGVIFSSSLEKMDMAFLKGDAHNFWMKELNNLQIGISGITNNGEMEKIRSAFQTLSDSMIKIKNTIGTSGEIKTYRFFCPMAFNQKGAFWLQESKKTNNPYFEGSDMASCGELKAGN